MASKAVFTGNVSARQGELLLRTSQLTAFYAGRAGLGLSDAGAANSNSKAKAEDKAEIVRLEARQSVIMTSKDQSATASWADFDVKANTALLGGGVVVDKLVPDAVEKPPGALPKRNIVTGDRLRIDLTTGTYQFEADPAATAATTNGANRRPQRPALSSSPPAAASATAEQRFRACPPGRQCGVIFPEQVKRRAIDVIKKRQATDAKKKKAPDAR